MEKIAILNTGTELTVGDILSTNGQYAARKLQDEGFSIGMHIVVSDNQIEIEDALNFLLKDHKAIIVSGGLGPTSDDRTRFALSTVLNEPLVFHDASWDRIVKRFAKFKSNYPDNNRTQALFPEKATIFPNQFGSADACQFTTESKQSIFLLPGPPREYTPIFDKFVMPALLKQGVHQPVKRASWLLINMSESIVADQLDPLIPLSENLDLGYRVDYPYLEVKLKSNDSALFEKYFEKIEEKIKSNLISRNRETAIEQLKKYLNSYPHPIFILDHATGGLLEAGILTTENCHILKFTKIPTQQLENKNSLFFHVKGLEAYWENEKHPTAPIDIQLHITNFKGTQSLPVHISPQTINLRKYGAETTAWAILSFLKEHRNG